MQDTVHADKVRHARSGTVENRRDDALDSSGGIANWTLDSSLLSVHGVSVAPAEGGGSVKVGSSQAKRSGRSLFGVLPLASCLLVGFMGAGISEAMPTEPAYVAAAREIKCLDYRTAMAGWMADYAEHDPELLASHKALEKVMREAVTPGDLKELCRHPEPGVRTLALLRLINNEDPADLPLIQSLLADKAPTFPERSVASAGSGWDRKLKVYFRNDDKTVGGVAERILHLVGYERVVPSINAPFPSFEEWLAPREGNPEWIGWHRHIYTRIRLPNRVVDEQQVARLRQLRARIDGLPPVARAWTLLALDGQEAFGNWSTKSRPLQCLAWTDELVAAGKTLGPDALLQFLKDGTRPGMKVPDLDRHLGGGNFLLLHAAEFFRGGDGSHAAALLDLGHPVAAADADPSRAVVWLRAHIEEGSKGEIMRRADLADALAALLQHGGVGEIGFVVDHYYRDPPRHYRFPIEATRREAKDWKAMLKAVVADPRFADLPWDNVRHFVWMAEELSGEKISPRDGEDKPWPGAFATANRLRAFCGIPMVELAVLSESNPTRIPFRWKTPFPREGESHPQFKVDLSPDGRWLVVGRRDAPQSIRLIDAATGAERGTLAEPPCGFQFIGEADLLLWSGDEPIRHIDLAKVKDGQPIPPPSPFTKRKLPFEGWPHDMQISDDGRVALNGTEEGNAFIDLATMDFIAERARVRGNHERGVLSPDGKRFAVGGLDTVDLIDVQRGNLVAELPGHLASRVGWVPSYQYISFSSDGRRLATMAGRVLPPRVRVWDSIDGKMLHEWAAPADHFYSSPVMGPDGRFLLIAIGPEGFGWFNMETGISTLSFSHQSPTPVGFERAWLSRDGKRLVAQYTINPPNAPPESGLMSWDGPG